MLAKLLACETQSQPGSIVRLHCGGHCLSLTRAQLRGARLDRGHASSRLFSDRQGHPRRGRGALDLSTHGGGRSHARSGRPPRIARLAHACGRAGGSHRRRRAGPSADAGWQRPARRAAADALGALRQARGAVPCAPGGCGALGGAATGRDGARVGARARGVGAEHGAWAVGGAARPLHAPCRCARRRARHRCHPARRDGARPRRRDCAQQVGGQADARGVRAPRGGSPAQGGRGEGARGTQHAGEMRAAVPPARPRPSRTCAPERCPPYP